jgi:hypothetical protein
MPSPQKTRLQAAMIWPDHPMLEDPQISEML